MPDAGASERVDEARNALWVAYGSAEYQEHWDRPDHTRCGGGGQPDSSGCPV